MKYVIACDDDGHFHAYQLSQRKEIYDLITMNIEMDDAWANRDGHFGVNNAADFNALTDEQLERFLFDTVCGLGRFGIEEITTEPTKSLAADRLPTKPPQDIGEPNEIQKKRTWRKTLLSFTLAYPDLFGGDNASVSADLIENTLHVIDLLRHPWEDHITSINPGQGLCIEILFEREGSEVTMRVDRTGCSFHIRDGSDNIEDRINSTSWDMDYFEQCWESRRQYTQHSA